MLVDAVSSFSLVSSANTLINSCCCFCIPSLLAKIVLSSATWLLRDSLDLLRFPKTSEKAIIKTPYTIVSVTRFQLSVCN